MEHYRASLIRSLEDEDRYFYELHRIHHGRRSQRAVPNPAAAVQVSLELDAIRTVRSIIRLIDAGEMCYSLEAAAIPAKITGTSNSCEYTARTIKENNIGAYGERYIHPAHSSVKTQSENRGSPKKSTSFEKPIITSQHTNIAISHIANEVVHDRDISSTPDYKDTSAHDEDDITATPTDTTKIEEVDKSAEDEHINIATMPNITTATPLAGHTSSLSTLQSVHSVGSTHDKDSITLNGTLTDEGILSKASDLFAAITPSVGITATTRNTGSSSSTPESSDSSIETLKTSNVTMLDSLRSAVSQDHDHTSNISEDLDDLDDAQDDIAYNGASAGDDVGTSVQRTHSQINVSAPVSRKSSGRSISRLSIHECIGSEGTPLSTSEDSILSETPTSAIGSQGSIVGVDHSMTAPNTDEQALNSTSDHENTTLTSDHTTPDDSPVSPIHTHSPRDLQDLELPPENPILHVRSTNIHRNINTVVSEFPPRQTSDICSSTEEPVISLATKLSFKRESTANSVITVQSTNEAPRDILTQESVLTNKTLSDEPVGTHSITESLSAVVSALNERSRSSRMTSMCSERGHSSPVNNVIINQDLTSPSSSESARSSDHSVDSPSTHATPNCAPMRRTSLSATHMVQRQSIITDSDVSVETTQEVAAPASTIGDPHVSPDMDKYESTNRTMSVSDTTRSMEDTIISRNNTIDPVSPVDAPTDGFTPEMVTQPLSSAIDTPASDRSVGGDYSRDKTIMLSIPSRTSVTDSVVSSEHYPNRTVSQEGASDMYAGAGSIVASQSEDGDDTFNPDNTRDIPPGSNNTSHADGMVISDPSDVEVALSEYSAKTDKISLNSPVSMLSEPPDNSPSVVSSLLTNSTTEGISQSSSTSSLRAAVTTTNVDESNGLDDNIANNSARSTSNINISSPRSGDESRATNDVQPITSSREQTEISHARTIPTAQLETQLSERKLSLESDNTTEMTAVNSSTISSEDPVVVRTDSVTLSPASSASVPTTVSPVDTVTVQSKTAGSNVPSPRVNNDDTPLSDDGEDSPLSARDADDDTLGHTTDDDTLNASSSVVSQSPRDKESERMHNDSIVYSEDDSQVTASSNATSRSPSLSSRNTSVTSQSATLPSVNSDYTSHESSFSDDVLESEVSESRDKLVRRKKRNGPMSSSNHTVHSMGEVSDVSQQSYQTSNISDSLGSTPASGRTQHDSSDEHSTLEDTALEQVSHSADQDNTQATAVRSNTTDSPSSDASSVAARVEQLAEDQNPQTYASYLMTLF
ncbi:hypothetical protein BaOVIS_026590 [Babesia ovis]|uniref:Uncharacterized protein n=1 Tax=Babesia ovis TaxID=5869 RepID=A0A9W5TC65_BABOV|nr:hypothetical protein BaOVIS_026590 [Babesia ovis]